MDFKKITIKILKDNLSKELRNTGKSAAEISVLTGMSYSLIIDYMNETRFPYIKNFDKLVEILKLDESKIMNVDLVNNIIDKR